MRSSLVRAVRHSPAAFCSALAMLLWIAAAALSPVLSPYDAADPAQSSLEDSLLPPGAITAPGQAPYYLGTDDEGRDLLSAILYGLRRSLIAGALATALAAALGIAAGLAAGYSGGWADAILMRAADVQLAFPALLIALLADGVAGAFLPRSVGGAGGMGVLVFAIGVSRWPQFARIVRGSAMVERGRDYVLAARIAGSPALRILSGHILPNVAGPALVIGTLTFSLSILDEASLSFLGVGMPADKPSLGTLVRMGSGFLYSGEWWLTVFPGATLVLLLLCLTVLGDCLQDALSPDARIRQ